MSEENRELPNDGSPPGHIEKMLGRKPEGSGTENESSASENNDVVGSTGEVAQRPDDIPEKFWDAEKGEVNTAALLKSQQDAEAALRKAQNGETPKEEGEPTKEEGEVTESQAPVVANATKEWEEKGQLSAATYEALESVGLTKDMVNTYIQGQQAIVSSLTSAAYEPFGGEDGYSTAANWAAEHLEDAEIDALDLQLTSTNPAIVKKGAESLAKMYAENADIEPSTIRGNANSPTSGDVYHSRAEMIRDMGSAKYRTDSGFRKEVEEKLRRSKLSRG